MSWWRAAIVLVPPIAAAVAYPLLERRHAGAWATIEWRRDNAYRSARAETAKGRPPRIVRVATAGCFLVGSLVIPWLVVSGWLLIEQFPKTRIGRAPTSCGGLGRERRRADTRGAAMTPPADPGVEDPAFGESTDVRSLSRSNRKGSGLARPTP